MGVEEKRKVLVPSLFPRQLLSSQVRSSWGGFSRTTCTIFFIILILPLFKPALPQATKVIMGNMKNSKAAPILRDLTKDTLPLIEKKRKKPLCQVDSNLEPLDYKTVALTTLSPPLPRNEVMYAENGGQINQVSFKRCLQAWFRTFLVSSNKKPE